MAKKFVRLFKSTLSETELNERLLDYCEMYSINIDELSPFEKYDIEDKFIQWDLEDFKFSLNDLTSKFGYIVTGVVELWNGKHEIEPVVFDTIEDIINRITSSDSDYLEVVAYKGYIKVYSSHHDGTNVFEIRELNERGRNAGHGADLRNRSYHKAIEYYNDLIRTAGTY